MIKRSFLLFMNCLLIVSGLVALCLLDVTADAADLKDVRIKPFGQRTEIILDLKGKADDVALNTENPNLLTLQFSGKIDTTLKARSRQLTGHSNLKSVYWESNGEKVQLFVKRHAPSTLNTYSLSDPERLVINIGESYDYKRTYPVIAAVLHHHIVRSSSRGPLNINVLEVDPSENPDIIIEPVLATYRLHGKAKVSQMVNQSKAVAGINAAFFKPDSGTNLGTVILNRELIAGPIYNRVSLGLTSDKKFKMARLSLTGSLTTGDGRSIPVHNVNQPRLSEDQYILYSSRWGKTAPKTDNNSIQIQIDNNRITAISNERLEIPGNGYVITGPSSGLTSLLQSGTEVFIDVYTTPDWSDVEHALSGGPYLVKSGQIYVDTNEQSFRQESFKRFNPRTAVGFTADNHLLMVTVDGRQQNLSVGVTLHEMARIMKDLGCVEAMNFDGGSSTQMVVKGQVVNSPSVSGGARVSSSLVIRQAEPSITKEIIGATEENVSSPAHF